MRGGIGLAVVVVLASAPAAAAAPQFLSAATIEGPSTLVSMPATYPRVAMDAQGETALVWGHYDSAAGTDVLSVALRPPGGSFGPPQELDRGQTDDQVTIASNAAGDMAVMWAAASGHVKASFRPAGGSFGPAADVSQLASGHPAVRVDDNGDAVAVWESVPQVGPGEEIDASSYVKAGGVWSAPHAVSAPGVRGEQTPALALDGAGHAVVLWPQGSGSNGDAPSTVTEADGVAGQGFGAPHPLGESGSQDPAVAIGPSGQTTAMWMFNNQIEEADRPAGGAFSAATIISGSSADWPQVAVDGHGDAVAVWERNSGVEGSVRPAGGAFPTQGTPLSDAGNLGTPIPSLVMGADGTALAFWAKAVSGQYRRIEAAVRLPGGALGPAVTVEGIPYSNSEFVDSESGAADGVGDGAAVLRHVAGDQERVDLAAFDGAGPRLDALSIPSTAVAGAPAAFSVAPVDVWSPVATISWAFGDGGTADGAAPSHAYATAGADAVTVRTADALGNASSAGGTVAVTAAAAPDITPPAISGLSMSHRRFRVGKTATAVIARRAPRGTTFRLRLSEAAAVKISFARRVAGRRSGRRCVKPAKRLRHARHCARYVGARALTRHLMVGPSAVPFSGRVGRHALRPGRYRATLRATDAAGNRSRTRTLSFRVVR